MFFDKIHKTTYNQLMKTKLVIFGLTGDLGTRKLLPAIDKIIKGGKAKTEDLEIIGVSRRESSREEVLLKALGPSWKESDLRHILSFYRMDLANLNDYKRLKTQLQTDEKSQIFLYLSVPPTSAAQISELAGKAGLNTPNVKILFEKPFGIDLLSAQDFLKKTHEYFPEKQILRVDHYLMKKSVRDLHGLFNKNQILSEIKANSQIKKIEIIASEQIDIQERGIFYEQTGALRDFIQNHLISVLATILANENVNFRSARQQVLHNISPILDFESQAIRAQYNGYKTEVENQKSSVETFAKITLFSESEDWKNIPLILSSGKALKEKKSQIKIYSGRKSSVLKIDLMELPNDNLPYEQVFLDAFSGKNNFFVSENEILESWRIFDPILKKWEFDNAENLKFYEKGTEIKTL